MQSVAPREQIVRGPLLVRRDLADRPCVLEQAYLGNAMVVLGDPLVAAVITGEQRFLLVSPGQTRRPLCLRGGRSTASPRRSS